MARRTKIVATIGPASDAPAVLDAMIGAGMDVARLGLAHGPLEESLARYDRVRQAGRDAGRELGVLVDLPGPKIRVAPFTEAVELRAEGTIRLTGGRGESTGEVIQVDHDEFVEQVLPGDLLRFGDGSVVVELLDRSEGEVTGRVRHGGRLQGRPGVHIPSERLKMPTPTPDDLRLIDAFVDVGVDMIAVSFVRSAHDMRRVGTEPHPHGPLLVAKVETRAAVENLDGIIDASGAVMVARGDLGAELPIEELPHAQKRIIRQCIALGRPAITATQMLESMIHAPTPTRAEASDVANAVFDGSSAVMLSGETAIGADPAGAVQTMASIAERADEEFDYEGWAPQLAGLGGDAAHPDSAVTDTMTMAAWRVAAESDAAAIICLSRSGFTVRAIARFRPPMKILGFSPDERTVRQLTLSWGAQPLLMAHRGSNEEMVQTAVEAARAAGEVAAGDRVVVLAGSDERSRATDVLRLVTVPA